MTLASAMVPRASRRIGETASFAGWPLLAILVASALFWLLVWHGEILRSMIEMWMHSETFAHGFLIVPISGWLIWRQRHDIQMLAPRANFWMLLPLAIVGFVWLLGNLASVVVVQQYCLIFMLLLLVATILGNEIVKVLTFPLLFLLFAVPFGEILLPTLMEHTADFAVFALRLSGIPVYREGLYFTVPSGNWSVVEACSGLRYLIASLTLGFLYAYLTYRSLMRRVIFIVLSIAVPIVANWVRAYMIVMIGHLSSMKLAVGVDHLIYGWLFFGIVMLLLFWIGSFWREDEISAEAKPDSSQIPLIGQSQWAGMVAATILAAGTVSALPVVASYIQSGFRLQPNLQAPPESGRWQRSSGSLTDWMPEFINPSSHVSQVYSDGSGRVALYIGYYRKQRQNAELVTSQNALVHTNHKVWGRISEMPRVLRLDANKIDLIESKLRSPMTQLLVWHWYSVDGQYTTNPYWAKLLQAKSQLLGRGDDGAVIIVSTVIDMSSDDATNRLRAFVSAMSPAIATSLQNAR